MQYVARLTFIALGVNKMTEIKRVNYALDWNKLISIFFYIGLPRKRGIDYSDGISLYLVSFRIFKQDTIMMCTIIVLNIFM